MAVSSGGGSMILTTESIPKYLKEHWELIRLSLASSSDDNANDNVDVNYNVDVDDALKGIEVNTIQGGNVNYAFCIKFPSMDNRIVFLKQVCIYVCMYV
jgi:hypothetical protein